MNKSVARYNLGDASVEYDNPARMLAGSFSMRVGALLALHVVLAYAMRMSGAVGALHALCVLALGLYFLAHEKNPQRLIVLTAYLTGSEILWRMTEATIFWEFGKYAVSFLYILTLLKYNLLGRMAKWPLLFFVLLIPAIFIGPSLNREVISFNLSGPFSLAVAAAFFSTIRLERRQVKYILLALAIPVVGATFLATYSTLTAGPIHFGRSSLHVTSGGYGPNQVSSILGLGALACLLYAFVDARHRLLRLGLIACSLWMLAQAALTFSRGGILTTVATLMVAGIFFLGDRRTRSRIVTGSLLALLVWWYLVFPAINGFTGGALVARFQDNDLTGRDKIVEADLFGFRENPVFGVGLGESRSYHALFFRESAAHTEFSRWLSEHGSFGLVALLIFMAVSAGRVFARMPAVEKALVLSFTVWTILFMSHAAMRLVAPSFLFGLASARFVDEAPTELQNATGRDD